MPGSGGSLPVSLKGGSLLPVLLGWGRGCADGRAGGGRRARHPRRGGHPAPARPLPQPDPSSSTLIRLEFLGRPFGEPPPPVRKPIRRSPSRTGGGNCGVGRWLLGGLGRRVPADVADQAHYVLGD